MGEPERIKRLRYRSWHRGCKETDLILGRFSESGLAVLAPAQLDTYEKLLDEDDADIWNWIIGKGDVPERYAGLLENIKCLVPRD